jgi:hypothetical protein
VDIGLNNTSNHKMTADLNDLNLKIEKIEKVGQNLSMEQSELSKSVSSKFSNIE